MTKFQNQVLSAFERHVRSCALLDAAGWSGPNAQVVGAHGNHAWRHPSGAKVVAAKHGWHVGIPGKPGAEVNNPEDAIPLVQ